MTWTRFRIPLLALGAAAVLALVAGCGSDESGQDTTAAEVSIPSPTSPLPTTATPAGPSGGGKQKAAKPTPTTGGAAACAIPDAFQNFKYAGLDCSSAVSVAQAWDSNGNACNTVDNPNVDAGYRRTCTVEGYSCTAKRDVRSDARFVTCTQGDQSIRFTWLPG